MDARGALSRTLVTFSSTSSLDLGHRIIGGGGLLIFDSIIKEGRYYNLGLIHPDMADEGIKFELGEASCTILANGDNK